MNTICLISILPFTRLTMTIRFSRQENVLIYQLKFSQLLWLQEIKDGMLCCSCIHITKRRKKVKQRIGHFRYINIRAWLQGFRVKIANFSSFLCPSIPNRDLDTKKTTPNIEVWPESLGAMLEYWYIERGLLKSTVFINLIY